MALERNILFILLVAIITLADSFSLPPAKFLIDFAMKYQRDSIVMYFPKDVSNKEALQR